MSQVLSLDSRIVAGAMVFVAYRNSMARVRRVIAADGALGGLVEVTYVQPLDGSRPVVEGEVFEAGTAVEFVG